MHDLKAIYTKVKDFETGYITTYYPGNPLILILTKKQGFKAELKLTIKTNE